MNTWQSLLDDLNHTFRTGLTRPVSWRKEQLKQLLQFLNDHEQDLLDALKKDLGKHPSEARLTELQFLRSDIKHTLASIASWVRPQRVKTPMLAWPAKSELVPEPLGTVLILGAWNYPVQLLLAPLIAAIAAGNCAVIKPSEHAKHVAQVMGKNLPNYLDASAIRVVNGEVDVSSELTQLPFDHIFYTGGEQAARAILAAAAPNLTPVTLELGGKSPAVVLADSDIKVSARRIVWGKFLNAGQTCIAPDYVLVEEAVKAELIEQLTSAINEFYGDDPQTSDDYGRIIHQAHYQRLVDSLKDQHILHGGDFSKRERYIAPTLVDNVEASHSLMKEEIFGPILPIVSIDSANEAIEYISARPKPLALYVFSKNKRTLKQFTQRVAAGNVCYNDTLMFMLNDEMPFGGVGRSGMGRYHGRFGFDTFSHLKPVMTRRFMLDVALRYPPYSRLKDKVLSWFS
ncbi:aldehyde dehydrogenase family protein [Idiomarina sp. OT37-5b]|jgi:aldehyde dehydrogenase (NAD+)|uniref:aldehyde dehydrogenase family protein n=1 Tax=Idiomarina sp. OT37-5b TaxID=2100422 RepID=UPI000CF9D359|nr:aldehyde dehydrogenase family protein [Idiomarina sp. OT37-5b]AVJ56583.1 aldehyde dehydrogenase family protein [Idiomarina sp. OT37-5b]